MQEIADDAGDYLTVADLYDNLSKKLKESPLGQYIDRRISSRKNRTDNGSLALDFTQNDADGRPVRLSDFKGKYVLVDFWASWCRPCRMENPNVVEAYIAYKDKNFTVLGVSLDRPGQRYAWLRAVEEDGLTWTQVSDLRFWDNEVAKLYQVRSIPANFLIDPDGKIVGRNLRGRALERRLKALLP